MLCVMFCFCIFHLALDVFLRLPLYAGSNNQYGTWHNSSIVGEHPSHCTVSQSYAVVSPSSCVVSSADRRFTRLRNWSITSRNRPSRWWSVQQPQHRWCQLLSCHTIYRRAVPSTDSPTGTTLAIVPEEQRAVLPRACDRPPLITVGSGMQIPHRQHSDRSSLPYVASRRQLMNATSCWAVSCEPRTTSAATFGRVTSDVLSD